MVYKPNDYKHLFGMNGFSNQILENHFTLYQGYVEQSNKLVDAFSKMDKNPKNSEFAEFRRRFGWEFNGMRLHEYYFDNLGGKTPLKKSALQKAIDTQFGSFGEWQREFEAVAGMRGIGWAALYHDNVSERLLNVWVNEHDVGHLASCTLILIIDVWEHAFMIDYGLQKADYIRAFMANISWETASDRFDLAVHVSASTSIA